MHRGCDEMIHAGERRKVVFTDLDRQQTSFHWTYLPQAFQQADLAISCGFIEWYTDSPGWGLACKQSLSCQLKR